MIEFRTLGSLLLRDPDGGDIQSVLAQPKRIALLAYLAIARPHGFHRRDTLLALLWPEQDEQHARWALNQALRHLRAALGKEVLSSRGDEEVGIAPGYLWCDAADFSTALEANDLTKVLGLYQGDLLQGFHVSGCGEFERWLEEERVWLRRRAARAALTLAQREEARGELVAAGYWARRAFALSPDDEGEARRLIELLDRVGDRAGAVQVYEEFARRLRDEYELEPAPQTLATITAVRTRRLASAPAPATEVDQLANGAAQGPDETGAVSAPLARRPWGKALLAVGFLFLAGAGAIIWGPRSPPPVAPDALANTVAVFPFAYRGSSEFAYLGEGMVDLLSANLNGAGELRSVDPHTVFALARQNDRSPVSTEQARRMAGRLRAASFVLGDVVEAQGRVRINARLRRSDNEEESVVNATVEGPPNQLFQLVDALTVQLLRAQAEGSGPAPAGLAAVTTDSLAALKAYLEGGRWFRAGRFDHAIEALRRATQIDPTFALANYRLATNAEFWAGWESPATEAVDGAMRHSQRLGPQHRLFIQALVAFHEQNGARAVRLYRQIVTAYPSDLEAWFQLGHVMFHGGGDDYVWSDARGAFERVLDLEPRHAPALFHLATIATRERKRAEVEILTQRLLELDPHPTLAAFARAHRAVVIGDSAELGRFMSLITKAADGAAQGLAGILTFTSADLALGRQLWGLIAHPSRPRGYRVLAYKTLAQIELMNGRWRAAQRQLDSAAMLDPATALEHRVLFSLWPLQQVSRSELLALRDSVRRWKAAPGPSNETSLTAELAPAHPYLRLYLLGMLNARLDEYPLALEHAAELERRAAASFAPGFVARLGAAVRAEVARRRGRPGEALAIFDRTDFWTLKDVRITGNEGANSPFYGREYERFSQAELLDAVGRHGEALAIFRAMAGGLFHSGAPAHLRMAQIYERQGNRQKAAAHYAEFAELWKDCDPEFRPLVEDARRRAARLN